LIAKWVANGGDNAVHGSMESGLLIAPDKLTDPKWVGGAIAWQSTNVGFGFIYDEEQEVKV
jgi:hypothetical protein